MVASRLDRLFGPIPDLPAPRGLDADRRASWVLWSAAVLIVLLDFRGGITLGGLNADWANIPEYSLAGRLYWVAWGVISYLAVPLAIIALVLRESPARYGLRIHFTPQMLRLYAVLLLVMIVTVYLASFSPAFVKKYPMANDLGQDWSRIAAWELIRAFRFVCLEFFFRGYLLFGLEARFGYHAIAVAALPYGIVHHGKPFAEALGAVLAGAVLGFMALRSRSIAGGVLLHVGSATAMDMFALYQKGLWD